MENAFASASCGLCAYIRLALPPDHRRGSAPGACWGTSVPRLSVPILPPNQLSSDSTSLAMTCDLWLIVSSNPVILVPQLSELLQNVRINHHRHHLLLPEDSDISQACASYFYFFTFSYSCVPQLLWTFNTLFLWTIFVVCTWNVWFSCNFTVPLWGVNSSFIDTPGYSRPKSYFSESYFSVQQYAIF